MMTSSSYGKNESWKARQTEGHERLTTLSAEYGTSAADFHAALDQFAVEQRMSVTRR